MLMSHESIPYSLVLALHTKSQFDRCKKLGVHKVLPFAVLETARRLAGDRARVISQRLYSREDSQLRAPDVVAHVLDGLGRQPR